MHNVDPNCVHADFGLARLVLMQTDDLRSLSPYVESRIRQAFEHSEVPNNSDIWDCINDTPVFEGVHMNNLINILEYGKCQAAEELIECSLLEVPGTLTVVRKINAGGYSNIFMVADTSRAPKGPGNTTVFALKTVRDGAESGSHIREVYENLDRPDDFLRDEFRLGSAFEAPRGGKYKPVPDYKIPLRNLRVAGQNTFGFTMTYIDGHNLADFLVEKNPDLTNRIKLFTECAYAASYVHGTNNSFRDVIIHKDIRPHNFMISSRGNKVYIFDFNLSSGADYEKKEAGKREYIPVEYFEGQRILQPGDIYSLGVMGYEILCGEMPYEMPDESFPILVKEFDPAVVDQITPPHTVNPEIPIGLSDAIMKCLKRNPAERYQNAIELYEVVS